MLSQKYIYDIAMQWKVRFFVAFVCLWYGDRLVEKTSDAGNVNRKIIEALPINCCRLLDLSRFVSFSNDNLFSGKYKIIRKQ